MLVGTITPVPVPHEEGVTFGFRQLAGVELDEAEEKTSEKGLRLMGSLSEEQVRALRSQSGGEDRDNDSDEKYDKQTLLNFALVEWSYEVPCTPENKRLLDPITRDWAVEYILSKAIRPKASMPDSGESSGEAEV